MNYFRKLGIEITPVEPCERVNWWSVFCVFLVSVASGGIWLGIYWTATLALRALGVVLTGVPK